MTDPTPEIGGTWITDPGDPRLTVLWAGATDYPEGDLEFPLEVARIQCIDFAPALAADALVPANYVAGQVMQARALVRAGVVGSGDQSGFGDDTVTLFPMDWTVKNVLRPRKGMPYFGGRRNDANG